MMTLLRPKWNASVENMCEDRASYIKSVIIWDDVKVQQTPKIFNIVKYIILFTGD